MNTTNEKFERSLKTDMFNFDPAKKGSIYWVPVRHHSPQCSRQLAQVFRKFKPDVVLIEGPSEATSFISDLQSKQTKPPVALYLHVVDKKNLWEAEDNKTRYRCYIPFDEMSPEWNALELAAKSKIPAKFIDLPYQSQLSINLHRSRFSDKEDQLLYDDEALSEKIIIKNLISSSHCRDFDEWWDRHFETGTSYNSPEPFFYNMHQFCQLVRDDEINNQDPLCLAREKYMALKIKRHIDKGKKCLVVTGGYHGIGINYYLKSWGRDNSLDEKKFEEFPGMNSLESKIYIIPYSRQRLNSTIGYSAGMPDFGYYSELWKRIKNKKQTPENMQEFHSQLASNVFASLSKNKFTATIPDSIESVALSNRLANLRNVTAGRTEFKDSIETAFVKSSYDHDAFQKIVKNILQGDAKGQVASGLLIAPIIEDFRKACQAFRLPRNPSDRLEKNLDIYKSTRHQQVSHFFHQLEFLEIPYAWFNSGPQFSLQKDLKRVREIWDVQWSVETEVRLIEQSYLGESVQEAALHLLLMKMDSKDSLGRIIHGKDKVPLLVKALSMGMHDIISPILQLLDHWIDQETEAIYLCEGFNHLAVVYRARAALSADNLSGVQEVLKNCFERICARLPWFNSTSEEQVEVICTSIINMYQLVSIDTPWCSKGAFCDSLIQVNNDIPTPKLNGLCTGILYDLQRLNIDNVKQRFYIAFGQAALNASHLGEFLWGFLLVAKGRFISDNRLQEMLTEIIEQCDEEEFIVFLPALRMAFTSLSPRELRSLTKALILHSDCENPETVNFSAPINWNQQDLELSLRLRQELSKQLAHWGIDS
ncbi:DUF5682 family protein [Pleionea mediterranea]|uniref:Uncharacterized protein n=1 Tax=Pleionea mediterranea TaxID=523701 RepID=A0A316FSN0_9GAMM|nr:DUF5682 family protein [Pleionea mediterranea]PWK51778.1 hypothetical protein C8D97_10593 [Pleionea mediterranea]